MAGAREGRRIRTLKVTGEGGAGKFDGYGQLSGERSTPCGISYFRYAGADTGDAWVRG